MRSAGSRSGVNWMRWKLRVDRVGERLDGERLGQAGHAFEQHVAVGEQADQQPLDHRSVWPTMTLPDLGEQGVDEGALLLDQLVEGADVDVQKSSPGVERAADCKVLVLGPATHGSH